MYLLIDIAIRGVLCNSQNLVVTLYNLKLRGYYDDKQT